MLAVSVALIVWNIFDCSTIVRYIPTEDLVPYFKYTMNGRDRSMCYFNFDGIYPKWAIFMKQ